MESYISPLLFACAWLVGILLSMEIGRRIGARFHIKENEHGTAGLDLIAGSVFALCGLLIAFTLTGGASRYDERRMLIADEANDIGTAYLRLDLLPDTARPALRQLFREYVDSRVAAYAKIPDMEAAKAELVRSAGIQHDIWNRSLAATRVPGAHVNAGILLMPAINNMIEITTTRFMATRIHPPHALFYLLFVLGIGCALVTGIRMVGANHKRWLYIFVFTIIMCMSSYVILAIEYPRMSFIKMGSYDHILLELKDGMK